MSDQSQFAFPLRWPVMANMQQPGMTLRQWYAGLAMQGLVARVNYEPCEAARTAFEIADEMLKASES